MNDFKKFHLLAVIFLASNGGDTTYILKTAFSIGMMDGTILFITDRVLHREFFPKNKLIKLSLLALSEHKLLAFLSSSVKVSDYPQVSDYPTGNLKPV